MDPQVVRYSERPELRDSIGGLSDEVWPEYNQHGQTLNYYWAQLYDVFPDWQFVLYDPAGHTVLAEGHTIPLAWDGTDPGLGPGIDATIAAAFELRAAAGQPTAVSALAAEIPPRHQRRHLSGVLLPNTAMAGGAGKGRDLPGPCRVAGWRRVSSPALRRAGWAGHRRLISRSRRAARISVSATWSASRV